MVILNRPPTNRAVRWARLLLVLAGVLSIWALVVAMTGGIRSDVGSLRVSSRNPARPALVAILLAAVAWRLAYRASLERQIRRWAPVMAATAPGIVWTAACCVLWLGMRYGVRAAGGSDALGYISESELWLRGMLRIDQGIASRMPWPEPEGTFAPLGYRPAEGYTMVPTYPPGLPLLMAATRSVSDCGPYLIAPVCAALLVIFSYLLGRRYFGGTSAFIGGLLLAASPVLLYSAMFPMTDVPAAMVWAAALWVVGGRLPGRVAIAGFLTGAAIAIRPNLVPLVIFPWLLAIVRDGGARGWIGISASFAAGLLPFVAIVMSVNNALYEHPLTSGYGALAGGFAVDHASTNMARYPAWWLESQGPLAFLFIVGVVRRLRRADRNIMVLMVFCAAVFASYLFYIPFDAWWFLRFVLPAVPIVFLFCGDALEWMTSRLAPTQRVVALFVLTCAILAHAVTFNQRIPVTSMGEGEQKYVDVGVFIGENTPPEAVIISMQHSGSIRYYSGRLTLRYDALDPAWLDRAVASLEQNGRPVYLLLDAWEEPVFRQRFEGQTTLARLDGGPAAVGRSAAQLFYQLGNARVALSSSRIPRSSRFECRRMSPGFVTAGR